MGKDIIARAKNGTGKTGSFVIPILERVDFSQKSVQSLVLVPTRELALQTSSTIKEIGKYLNVQCMITTGGTSLKEDIYRLYNPVQVLVGTPGRVYDLANKGALDLSKCGILVLDEADKLLSQDFQKVLESIDTPFVRWDIDTNDWRYHDAEYITKYVLENYSNGDIILFHDSYDTTVKAINKLVPILYNLDVQVLSITEYTKLKNINLENHKMYFDFK